MFRRYAIYVVPKGPLAALGAAWLGWDIAAGQAVPQPHLDGLDVAALTKRPRKYGLHATIKPPMFLAQGTTQDGLLRAAHEIAERLGPVELDGLQVARIGRFIALTGVGNPTALNTMAATVVETLDLFRAPPSPEELIRRRKSRLTHTRDDNLTRWGYPHVMDDYRFHITLTGPLKDPEGAMPHVATHFEPALPAPFMISDLALVGEDAEGMFHTIARLPLG
jgi:hypothetical protein